MRVLRWCLFGKSLRRSGKGRAIETVHTERGPLRVVHFSRHKWPEVPHHLSRSRRGHLLSSRALATGVHLTIGTLCSLYITLEPRVE